MNLVQRFRQIKKLPDFLFWFPARFISFMRLVMRTEIDDPYHQIDAKSAPAVVTVWHNRLLFFPVMFAKWEREHTVAVISASRDGQYIADLCRQWHVESVRGSTSRQAVQVIAGAMRSILKKGKYVAFTPDGPRGPRYVMSRGPIRLASETGVRLVPLAINYSSWWELNGWDRFQIPKPWAKITLRVGAPFHIPPNLTNEETDKWREILADAMNKLSGVDEKELIRAKQDMEAIRKRKAAKAALSAAQTQKQ